MTDRRAAKRTRHKTAATSRNSWFELLRILSMLFILWAHLGRLPGYSQTQGRDGPFPVAAISQRSRR